LSQLYKEGELAIAKTKAMAEELSWIRARKKGKKDLSKQKLIRGTQMLL